MYWSYTETEDHELFIHLGGLDDKGRTVHCRIDNFTPFVYLELPKRIKWNKVKCQTLFDFYQQRFKSEGPLEFRMFQKFKIHYKKKVNVMFLTFPTDATAKKFGNRVPRNSVSIYGLGSFSPGEFKVHESHSIDPIVKFTATRNITLASWVKLEEYIPEAEAGMSIEERRFTTADVDLYCDWRNVHPYTPQEMIIVQPKYCSFDIECYSQNHNSRMPDPEQAENVVFQIALVFGKLRDPNQRRVLLTLFNPDDIDGVEVVRFPTERELMMAFTDLIRTEDPDIFITYNGMKFDWDYLITRSDRGGFYPKFAKMSRIVGERAERKMSSWGSNAYGQQEFKYLECHGRTNVDVLLEVERNYKLSIYSLNAVSENFLKESKVDITPKQLFMLYRINFVMLPLLQDCKAVTATQFSKLLKQAESLLPVRECHGIVKDLRKTILGSTTVKQLYDNVREGIRVTGVYCVQDTALPIKLVDKLNLWPTMEGMSNCMNVPMSYLHTRGQQVKVVAQIFRRTMTNNLIFSQGEDEVTKYQGATVIDANAGDYDNVAVLDFASLYPTVMIAYNICYTTLVQPDDPIPDSECHVLEWTSHRGCSHDKKKRSSKIKKEDILCGSYRYRFKRVKVHPDGTLEGVGILPELLRQLLVQRKKVRKVLGPKQALLKMTKGLATEKDLKEWKSWNMTIVKPGTLSPEEVNILEVEIGVLDAEQKALKVSANSVYGALGTKKGLLSFTAGAASVTAMSRHLIITAINWIVKKYPEKCTFKGVPCQPKLVYGDSVTGDTPVMVKNSKGIVSIVRIDELERVVNGEWEPYPLFKLDGAVRTEKQMIDTSDNSFQTWTASGWSLLRKVIKHKVNKRIYRVRTDTSYVDVTEDHSLLSPTLQKIKATDVVIGTTKLRTGFPSDVKGVMTHNNSHCTAVMEQCDYFINPTRGDGVVQDVTLLYDVGEYNDYVYDIETADGTFQAGVGEIIVKNTDSAMLEFIGANVEQTFDLAAESSHMATHVLKCEIMGVAVDDKFGGKTLDVLTDKDLPNLTDDEKCKYHYYKSIPIDFEFENVYGRYLLLTMKRYAAYVVNRDGDILSTTKKGVSVARRDNCKYLRDTYMAVLEAILSRKSEEVAMNIITDRINMLFTRQIPDVQLVIYVGISSVINYAKNKVITTLHGQDKVFLDANGNPIEDPIGPEDPRLVYSNLPQSVLAQKMMKRGDIVPANTRLEFLYLDLGHEVAHQGEKAEDYTYYKENRRHEQLRPDLLFYIEKQLLKPLTELITVKYPHEWIVFETVDERYARLSSELFQKSSLIKDRIEKVKSEIKIISQGLEGERTYKFKGMRAKIETALRMVSMKGNCIHPVHHKAFIEACKAWRARCILDALYKKHGLDKRPKRLTRVGDNLHVGCKIIYWKDKRRGYVVSVEKESTEVDTARPSKKTVAEALNKVSKRTVVTSTFTVMLSNTSGDDEVLSGIKRSEIAPLYKRDCRVIKDILGYRRDYKAVVESLNEMFSPLRF